MEKTIKWSKVERLAKENMISLIFNSELNFDFQVHNIAEKIFDDKKIKLVLVAGPSASGKTTFTNLLSERLRFMGLNVHKVSLDDFFLNRDELEYLPSGLKDFDSPKALDMVALRSALMQILYEEIVDIPHFDFLTGKRSTTRTKLDISKHDIFIIEGIHALNPILFEGVELNCKTHKISIAPRRTFVMPNNTLLVPNELRLLRRIIRDYHTRGHDIDATLLQWTEVLNAEKLHVLPYLESAHSEVDSVYEYELLIYKHYFYERLIKKEEKVLTNIIAALQSVADLEVPSIPSSSLINEFAFFD